jgi:hypothetical protein
MVARKVIKAGMGDGGMRCIDTAEQYHKGKESSKEKWTSNTTRQGNDESSDH